MNKHFSNFILLFTIFSQTYICEYKTEMIIGLMRHGARKRSSTIPNLPTYDSDLEGFGDLTNWMEIHMTNQSRSICQTNGRLKVVIHMLYGRKRGVFSKGVLGFRNFAWAPK